MNTLWKSMKSGLRSNYDNSQWVIGEWRKEKKPQRECEGLNASPRIIDSMNYVRCEILAKVEARGKIIKGTDKWTCEYMRIVDAYEWTKEESVRLSIFAAELCLENFEKIFPDDDRPRKAIEAAKHFLDNHNESAARSAAWSAAWSATWSAESAARSAESAESAARSAARSAASAAWSAEWSAENAARSAALNKIENYIQSRIPYLKRIKS